MLLIPLALIAVGVLVAAIEVGRVAFQLGRIADVQERRYRERR